MEKGELSLLESEISDQMSIINKLFEDINERKKGIATSTIRREAAAYKLHSLYCAFEDLFQIIARYFENQILNKTIYHKELLKRMKLNIHGIRPALISEKCYRLLDELRSFRHFFRHAYSYDIDVRKLKALLEVASEIKKIVPWDIEKFITALKAED